MLRDHTEHPEHDDAATSPPVKDTTGPTRGRRLLKEDDGQTTVLTLGMVTILLLLAAVILAITAVNVEARRLLSAADGAARAGAEHVALTVEEDPDAIITPDLASGSVQDYLVQVGAATRFEALTVATRVDPDSRSVEVRLTATARPPLVQDFIPATVTVEADSTSRTALER